MEQRSLQEIFTALNQASVNYLVVGGLAVVAHGYMRTTADLDLVIGLEPANIKAGLQALMDIGYRMAIPVTIEQFADPVLRERWRAEKGMMVRREVWERVGLIDERFFMYLEDVDLSLRASAAGYALAVVEGCGFYHKAHFGGGGSGQEKGSPFTRYHQLRSKLLLWRKHAGWWRFHTQFCPRHLAKYILRAGESLKCPEKRVYGEAYINALWAFLFHPRTAQRVIQSPDWFMRLMARRAWLVVWLMSFGRRD
jgi:hypothetical protein